jgi:hypothetical protein
MKKLIFAAFAIMAFAITSCKKSTNVITPVKPLDTSTTNISTPGYYVKFKLNGTQYNFGYAAVARLSGPDTLSIFYYANHYPSIIVGYPTAAKSTFFGIELWTVKPAISAGMNFTVTPSDTTTTENSDFAVLGYVQSLTPPGSVYVSQGDTPAVTVTVTALTSSAISGTFSGKLFGGTSQTLQYTVTDGEFYAKLE